MLDNKLDVEDEKTLNFLASNPSEEQMTQLKEKLEKQAPKSDNNEVVQFALQPIFRPVLHEASGKVEYKVDCYEMLGRTLGNTNIFPFTWYANLSKEDRVIFTREGVELSKRLQKKGINAKINVQMCDYEEVFGKNPPEGSIPPFEIAEFAQKDNGKVEVPPTFATGLFEDGNLDTLFGQVTHATLDDCLGLKRDGKYDEERNYDKMLNLVEKQKEKEYDLEEKPVTCIKIDQTVLNKAYGYTNDEGTLESFGRQPTFNKYELGETGSRRDMKEELNKYVRLILEADADMKFVLEYSIFDSGTEDNNALETGKGYIIDDALLTGKVNGNDVGNTFTIQGGALTNYAFRMTPPDNANVRSQSFTSLFKTTDEPTEETKNDVETSNEKVAEETKIEQTNLSEGGTRRRKKKRPPKVSRRRQRRRRRRATKKRRVKRRNTVRK